MPGGGTGFFYGRCEVPLSHPPALICCIGIKGGEPLCRENIFGVYLAQRVEVPWPGPSAFLIKAMNCVSISSVLVVISIIRAKLFYLQRASQD